MSQQPNSRPSERTFTYLNVNFMSAQQRNLPAPTLYTVRRHHPSYRAFKVAPETTKNGIVFVPREVRPGELASYAVQMQGCNIAFFEDHYDYEKLELGTRSKVNKDNAVVVREQEIFFPGVNPATIKTEPQIKTEIKTEDTEVKIKIEPTDDDEPRAGPSSRPWEV